MYSTIRLLNILILILSHLLSYKLHHKNIQLKVHILTKPTFIHAIFVYQHKNLFLKHNYSSQYINKYMISYNSTNFQKSSLILVILVKLLQLDSTLFLTILHTITI